MISVIFQDPMTSLNPVLTVEDQIAEAKERIVDLTKKHCSVSVTIAKNPGIALAME